VFSQRTRWSSAENVIARAVEERRRSGQPFIDLTETNPTNVGLGLRAAELAQALGHPDVSRYRPLPLGMPSAREAVAQTFDGRVPVDHICLTASTSEAYGWLFKLLCDPGDRVLVPAPGYPLFDYLATMENVQLVAYPSRSWDDWSIDFARLESQVTPTTRAIILVSPSNPTGAMLHRDDLPRLAALCARSGLAIICDEVFADYAEPQAARVSSLAGFDEVLTFVLGGLSKSCLLPQMKVGWIAVSGPAPAVAEAMSRLDIIADSYLSVNTPTQLALPTFLSSRAEIQRPLRARLTANRARLTAELTATAATVLPSDGGWSAVIRVPETCSEETWTLRLLEQGVLVHPGFFFDFEGGAYLVVSLIVPETLFAEAARVLRRILIVPE
jgi:alanine-synthesizing transaminase